MDLRHIVTSLASSMMIYSSGSRAADLEIGPYQVVASGLNGAFLYCLSDHEGVDLSGTLRNNIEYPQDFDNDGEDDFTLFCADGVRAVALSSNPAGFPDKRIYFYEFPPED